jgi:pimeloyl-ACP methyl ester carboxylesterase
LVARDTGARGLGLPVVLVHGINMRGDVWDGLVAKLGERRAISLDLRGHGDSVMAGPFDADGYADDVLAVMDDLGIERAHLVGASFGGPVVCAVAARAPRRVASITAIGSAVSAGDGVDIDGGIAAMRQVGARDFFTGFMGQASFAPGTDAAMIEAAADAASAGRDLDTIEAVTRTAFSADAREIVERVEGVTRTAFAADASDAVSKVKAPALVITGEHDMTCPVAAGKELASALGVELTVLPGRGHMAMVEAPASVAAPLVTHLAAHD